MPTQPPILRRLLRAQRRPLVLSLLGALGYLLTQLAQPLAVRHGVQGLIDDRSTVLTEAFTVLVGLGILRAASGALRKYQASLLLAGLGADLRGRVYAHLQRLDLGFHARMGSGQLLARASGDVTMVEQFAGMAPFVVQSLLVGLGGAALLFVLSPALAGLVLLVVLVMGALALLLARPMFPTSTALQDVVGDYTSFVEEQVHGIRVVKGHGFESAHRELGGDLASTVRHLGVGLGRQRARFLAALLAVPGAATLVVLAVGGHMALHGEPGGSGFRAQLSPADLLAFVQYLGLLVTPVMVSAQLLSVWPQVRAALRRIEAVLDAVPTVVSPRSPAALGETRPPALALRDVHVGYLPGEPVLRGVDIEVPAGTCLAVVGPSGSGKTTLLLLVERFLDPWSGRVELDGVDIRDLDLEELRSALCPVFQQPQLFAATVAQNVALGHPGATPEQVRRALSLAGCDGLLAALPHDVDSHVGEGGGALSGGQRQRVSVARALVRSAPVLLLDDVTSALDPGSAEELRASLARLLPGRTALLVAHHPETVRLADAVVVLEHGQVVARGTPDELAQHPAYRKALALGAAETSAP